MSAAPTVRLDAARLGYPVVGAASFDVLRAANVALCKSGTSTLEAAVAGCPCAIVYRTGRLSYAIAKRLVRIPHIGLLNIVAGRRVAPEFVQDDFEPVRVADALSPLFDESSLARHAMLAGLADVQAKLGTLETGPLSFSGDRSISSSRVLSISLQPCHGGGGGRVVFWRDERHGSLPG